MTEQDTAELARRAAAGDELDHTKCLYEVISAKPSRQPKRVSILGLHELISGAPSHQQMRTECQQIKTALPLRSGAYRLGRMEC
jgi:hypothetical protein